MAWLFTEGSGTTVADASGNSNTGNFASSGNPAWYSTSLPKAYMSYAANFDGTASDYIIGTNKITLTNDITIILWANKDAAYDSDMALVTESWDTEATWNAPYWRYGFAQSASNQPYFGKTTSGAFTVSIYASAGWFTDSTWKNYALTRSGSNTGFYSNGSGNSGGAGLNAGDIDSGNNIPPTLGIQSTYAVGSSFKGYMTEVAIFSRVLSSTEINDIMDNGLAGAAPTGYGQVI